MEEKKLRKLEKAVRLRNIDKIFPLIKKISPSEAASAEKILTEFYNHEVSVANAVIELIAYSKVHKSKIKPPFKGCFCFTIPDLKR
ncbi:hypothetical protein KMI_09g15310 [Encephalitozoon hellem]|uniref:Uncharacterized protein n=1 Tax=Encephalitozoon hellem TaxID=27973 RepID=A0A9Q9FAK7_ENCHE|nr:hypothetical protein KMI_09g15310 [Encephalitozoon hellem]UTX44466.1 hypothetical protein GPU96_11g22700 [Encephalitozoon hellem]WEL39967.1 hypothetical protein PFJ87_11g02050 [Encephalitozoon hellem]